MPKLSIRDRLASSLWSGDVEHYDGSYQIGNLAGRVNKQTEEERVGRVPRTHLSPFEGEQRPFDPFELRTLADTEAVQSAINHIVADFKAVDAILSDRKPDEEPASEDVRDLTQTHLDNITPNNKSRTVVDEVWNRDLLEVGNCIGIKTWNIDGKRVEVNPLDPNTFTVEYDRHGKITAFYHYPRVANARHRGNPIKVSPERVIWGTYQPESARGMVYGHSPVEKLRRVISIIGGLVEQEIGDLEEGMPPGIVSLVGDWSDRDYNKFEDYWKNNVQGERHKVPLAKGEAEFKPFAPSYSDLQLLDRQRWYYKLVGAIFMLPISENGLGIGQEVNRATDISQRQRYKQKVIRSMLQERETVWTTEVIQQVLSDRLQLKYDPGMDLMERGKVVEQEATLLQQGVKTINEVRSRLGKEPVEWGDVPPQVAFAGMGGSGGPPGGPPGGSGGGGGAGPPQPDRAILEEMGMTEDQIERVMEEGFKTARGGCPNCSSGITSVGKPFGPWQDFDDCVEFFMDRGDDRETARRKCGALEEELKDQVGKEGEQSIEDNPLRETDEWHQFDFQPEEMSVLKKDLSDLFGKFLNDMQAALEDNKDLWQADERQSGGEAEKSLPDFFKLIEEEIGIDLAQEMGEVLATHKTRQVLKGKDDIEQELREAGMEADDLNLEQEVDVIANRLTARSLEVTKPVSQRLKDDLQETIQEGWQEGKSITEVERDIEGVTDKWQGTDAERLARDQLGKAAKEGRLETAKETAGDVGGWDKTWLATLDSRTRDSHADMDGTTVGLNEPWVVDYRPDGGPGGVIEEYPGASRWGIQCRCDYELTPKGVAQSVRGWAEEMRETSQVAKSIEDDLPEGQTLGERLLALELRVERRSLSRNQARKDLGVGSKATYYQWIKQAGLYDEAGSTL